MKKSKRKRKERESRELDKYIIIEHRTQIVLDPKKSSMFILEIEVIASK